MKYTKEEMLGKVDHTLLKPEATWPQIQTLCDEAIANHCASVCINTCYVAKAAEYMAGRVPVCCVVGFPLGAMDTKSKAFEAKTAVENGASEVDMVINIGWLKNKQYDDVRNDIAAVKAAVGDKVLKVIIETCLLTDDEKRTACRLAEKAGADFVKTSTGRAGAPALSHIRIMREALPAHVGIKFSGFGTLNAPELALWAFFLGADVLGSPCGDVIVDVLSSGYAEVGMLAGS